MQTFFTHWPQSSIIFLNIQLFLVFDHFLFSFFSRSLPGAKCQTWHLCPIIQRYTILDRHLKIHHCNPWIYIPCKKSKRITRIFYILKIHKWALNFFSDLANTIISGIFIYVVFLLKRLFAEPKMTNINTFMKNSSLFSVTCI